MGPTRLATNLGRGTALSSHAGPVPKQSSEIGPQLERGISRQESNTPCSREALGGQLQAQARPVFLAAVAAAGLGRVLRLHRGLRAQRDALRRQQAPRRVA